MVATKHHDTHDDKDPKQPHASPKKTTKSAEVSESIKKANLGKLQTTIDSEKAIAEVDMLTPTKKKRKRTKKKAATPEKNTSKKQSVQKAEDKKEDHVDKKHPAPHAPATIPEKEPATKPTELLEKSSLEIEDIGAYIAKKKEQSQSSVKHMDHREHLVSKDGSELEKLPGLYAIVPHAKGDHKLIFLKKDAPKDLLKDKRERTKGQPYKKQGETIYEVKLEMHEHPTLKTVTGETMDVRVIDTPAELDAQMKAIAEGKGGGNNFGKPKIVHTPLETAPIITPVTVSNEKETLPIIEEIPEEVVAETPLAEPVPVEEITVPVQEIIAPVEEVPLAGESDLIPTETTATELAEDSKVQADIPSLAEADMPSFVLPEEPLPAPAPVEEIVPPVEVDPSGEAIDLPDVDMSQIDLTVLDLPDESQAEPAVITPQTPNVESDAIDLTIQTPIEMTPVPTEALVQDVEVVAENPLPVIDLEPTDAPKSEGHGMFHPVGESTEKRSPTPPEEQIPLETTPLFGSKKPTPTPDATPPADLTAETPAQTISPEPINLESLTEDQMSQSADAVIDLDTVVSDTSSTSSAVLTSPEKTGISTLIDKLKNNKKLLGWIIRGVGLIFVLTMLILIRKVMFPGIKEQPTGEDPFVATSGSLIDEEPTDTPTKPVDDEPTPIDDPEPTPTAGDTYTISQIQAKIEAQQTEARKIVNIAKLLENKPAIKFAMAAMLKAGNVLERIKNESTITADELMKESEKIDQYLLEAGKLVE